MADPTPDPAQLPPPKAIYGLIRSLDRLTDGIGRCLTWLAPPMVLITCAVVVMRYGLDRSSIALQESVTYLHAALFLLGAGYALKHHHQVRVDIVYRRLSPAGRAWIDALGALVFVVPLTVFTGWISQDFVSGAWRIREASTDSGGLAWVYLLKSLIPLFALTLLLQALAELLRNLLRLMGYRLPPSIESEPETH